MQLFPAIQGKLGTWKFYSTKMSAADLASQVKFADEVWEAKALNHWIQRALNVSRSKTQIARYLATQNDRFFNSIVVAAIEGNPKFFPIQIADDPQFAILADDRMNTAFGVLRFDGTQKYYALDGQHRLRAIKALLDHEAGDYAMPPGFESEEFSVIIVVQKSGESREDFMKKYRRLFSNLNRYAKPMDKATTYIMEEDDAFAILTRRLIQEHPFFGWIDESCEATRVRCEGSENLAAREPYFTTIIGLYKMTIELLFTNTRRNTDAWGAGTAAERLESMKTSCPIDDELDSLYGELVGYWNALLEVVPELTRQPYLMRNNISEDCQNDDDESLTNHLLFRPIGQELLAKTARRLLDLRQDDPDKPTSDSVREALKPLSFIEWRLFKSPWRHLLFVYVDDSWKMRSEDRKDAIKISLQVLDWVLGLTTLSAEAVDALRGRWKAQLINCSDEEAAAMWGEVEAQAVKVRAALSTGSGGR